MDTVNFGTEEFLADPYPTYRWLQENDPVHWMPFAAGYGGMWLVVRYDDVYAVLKDNRISKDWGRTVPEEQLTPLDRSMLFRDPPDHTRLRSLVNLAFTPKTVSALRPHIEEIADGLIVQMREQEEVDFVDSFALPLPVIVIAELLGIPTADREQFQGWSNKIIAATDGAHADNETYAESDRAGLQLGLYLSQLIAERRKQPRNDLISDLLRAHDGEQRLSEQELLGTCILLLIAGHETTVNLLGNGLLALLQHPEQMALLRQDPGLIPSGVEEMLRYDSPVQRGTGRFPLEPIEIAGTRIEPGQQVAAVIGAANRDPSHFPDPGRFDVRREPNRHLAFGFGIHFCLGAPLARAEGQIAFQRLLNAFPRIELAGEPVRRRNTFLRGLRRLPVGVGD
jgi:cytochrome P450